MPAEISGEGLGAVAAPLLSTALNLGMSLRLTSMSGSMSSTSCWKAQCASTAKTIFPTYGAYIASKVGVEGMIHVLANEPRGRNIP